MKTTIKVFAKVFVKTFYAENVSFFLVVIGLAFGFMSGVEHKALAEFFTSSPLTALIPVISWMLYALKVVRFNRSVTRRKENEFLFCHSLYPPRDQFGNVTLVLFNQLAPAFLYAIFLSAVALKHNAFIPLTIIVTGIVLIAILSSLTLKYRLSHPDAERKVWFIDRIFNKNFTRPYPLFLIEWLSRKKTFLLISTMVFCSLLLFGVLMLYRTDHYDVRLLQMALLIVASGNIQLIREVHMFETFHFTLINQQPFSFVKRLGYLVPVFAFISFPQIALLIRYFPADLSTLMIPECVWFLIAYSFFLYGIMYRNKQTQEQAMRLSFGLVLLLFVLTLFSLPMSLISVPAAAIGAIVWKRNFYTFELMSEESPRT